MRSKFIKEDQVTEKIDIDSLTISFEKTRSKPKIKQQNKDTFVKEVSVFLVGVFIFTMLMLSVSISIKRFIQNKEYQNLCQSVSTLENENKVMEAQLESYSYLDYLNELGMQKVNEKQIIYIHTNKNN